MSDPNGQSQQKSRAGLWITVVLAVGCILALLLSIIGGVGYLVLVKNNAGPAASESTSGAPTESESTSTSGTATVTDEPSPTFEVIAPDETPPVGPGQIRAILADNPITSGSLPRVGTCALPDAPLNPTKEQLQDLLNAAAGCLDQVWAGAMSDRNLGWSMPRVVVFEGAAPQGSRCTADTFRKDSPRMCNLDNTIYWPVTTSWKAEPTTVAELKAAAVAGLSYYVTQAMLWQSSVSIYANYLMDKYKNAGLAEEERMAIHRWNFQARCIAMASVSVLPQEVQPTGSYRDRYLDPAAHKGSEPPFDYKGETIAEWFRRGLDSQGDLATCNVWTVSEDEVS